MATHLSCVILVLNGVLKENDGILYINMIDYIIFYMVDLGELGKGGNGGTNPFFAGHNFKSL